MADKSEWKKRAKQAEAEVALLREELARVRAELATVRVKQLARHSPFGEILDVRPSPRTARQRTSGPAPRSGSQERIRAEVERVNHLLGAAEQPDG